MEEAYKDVIIGEGGLFTDDFGKPTMYMGTVSKKKHVWMKRRRITMAMGKKEGDDDWYIGEIRKEKDHWIWIWGIKLKNVRGYEDMVEEIAGKVFE